MREYTTSTSVQCGLNWKARSQSSEFSCQSALETGHQVLDIHTVFPSSSQVKGAVKARTPHGTQAQAGSKGQGQNFTMLKLLCFYCIPEFEVELLFVCQPGISKVLNLPYLD